MRGLLVNPDLCFGCRACSSVCPAHRILLQDEGDLRTLRFPGVCEEDCSRCPEVCPAGALALQAVAGAPETVVLTFPLRRCALCGQPFAPEKALAALHPRVRETLGGGETSWWDLCPACRRRTLAEAVSD